MSVVSLLDIDVAAAGSRPLRAGTTHRTPQAAAIKLQTGLVVVPFAVPVAVPVATVTQPSVLYSYRHYAPYYAARETNPSPASTPDASEQGENEPLDAAGILSRHCASCHTGAAAQGGQQLFQASGRIFDKLPRQAILEAIEQGRMPKPGTSRLTPAEIETLRQWSRPPRDLVY